MEEYQEFHTKLSLILGNKHKVEELFERPLELQIDASYRIGKSIAVLRNETVIGHLNRHAARTVWIHLKQGNSVQAEVYRSQFDGFQNAIRFSTLTNAYEVGVKVRIFFPDTVDGIRRISGASDAKFFLSYILKNHLNSFPGITRSNCPESLFHLI